MKKTADQDLLIKKMKRFDESLQHSAQIEHREIILAAITADDNPTHSKPILKSST